jgi:hypothetical protein
MTRPERLVAAHLLPDAGELRRMADDPSLPEYVRKAATRALASPREVAPGLSCHRCQHPIPSGEAVVRRELAYHPECLVNELEPDPGEAS